jgi:hypothetical protein
MKQRSSRLFPAVTLLTVIAFCFGLTACIVPSFEPWFSTTDRVFDDRLIGVWAGRVVEEHTDDHAEYRAAFSRDGKTSYMIDWSWRPGLGDTTVPSGVSLTGNLGKLGKCYFLDFRQLESASKESQDSTSLLYLHNIVRLELQPNSLTIWRLDGDSVGAAVRQHLIPNLKVDFLDDDMNLMHIPIVYSETNVLSDFLVAHGQEKDLWKKYMEFERK